MNDDDELTQMTQDPRRIGRNNSGLAEEDISDLLCILHPGTPAAFRIVAHTAARSPQNVLRAHAFRGYEDGSGKSALEEQETFILGTSDSAQADDLALRFSAKIIRPHMGFVFGRNAAACDVVLDTDTVKRISNIHFRIFINDSGVLMLEDMSTNGTIVDDIVLRKQQPGGQTRMLTNGGVIQILSPKADEIIKFIVRIPSRDGHMHEFEEKFRDYRRRAAIAEAHAREAEEAARTGRRTRPTAKHQTQTAFAVSRLASNNHFGMHWGGGDRYNVVGHIGKGAFALVYQLATKSDGYLFAAKELEKRRFVKNGVLDRKIDNELQIMKAINHPHVVQYIEYQDVGNYLYIIMEFVPCGDLNQYLNFRGALSEPLAKRMSAQVFDALDYLHRKKITHRDIKPDNILLADLDPATFTVKLSDFGLSKVVNTDDTFLKTFCGTLLYCAPEVFPKYDDHVASKSKKRPRRGNSAHAQRFHSYSQSVDIWSYGAVLWYSLCLRPPFEGVADATGDGMFNKIMMTPLDPTDLTKQGVSGDAVALLVEMLNTDPAARPTPAYCLNHLWFGSEFPAPSESYPEQNLEIIAEEQEHEGTAEPNVAGLSLDERDSGENSQTSEVSLNSGDIQFFDPRQSKRFKSENFGFRNKDGSFVQSSPEVLFDNIPIMNQATPERPGTAKPRQPKLFGEISQTGLQESAVLGSQNPQTSSHKSNSSRARSSSKNGSVHNGQQVDTQGAAASPSLLGAESMVRDLHMRSPNHSGSSPNGEPDEPTTPNTPSRTKHHSLEKGTPNDATPKPAHPPAFSRQIRLNITPSFYYDPSDPSTHNVEYASKVSGLDFISRPSYPSQKRSLPDTVAGSETDNDDEPHPENDITQSGPVYPALLPPAQFARPPPRLGKLSATPDSFAPITLNLSRRMTSWGRAPNNTDVYEDNFDTRVSKRALVLWFHAEGIDDIPEGDDSWTKLPGLKCTITTESSTGIYINGVHLKKGEPGKYLFGHLYTGDEVVVAKGKNGLKFICEFYHGECKDRRPEGEPKFKIRIAENQNSAEGELNASRGAAAAVASPA